MVANVNAQTWNETGDAGSLPADAQVITAGGALTNITGNAGGTDSDMYLLQVNDAANFRATTNEPDGGSATFDTQLWLFDDAVNNQGFHSTLLSVATDGSGQTVPGPGNYYVAISTFGNDPLSAGGEIFNQVTFTETSGPDGVGGGSPIIGWDTPGSNGGNAYNILLTGTKGVPEPATLGLLGLGALAMIRRRR